MPKSCKTPSRCAAMVRAAARRWRAEGSRYTSLEPAEQRHMRKVHERDAEDLESVARLVAEGDKNGAADRAGRMDTIVRDAIPLPVWCWMAPDAVIGGCRNGRS